MYSPSDVNVPVMRCTLARSWACMNAKAPKYEAEALSTSSFDFKASDNHFVRVDFPTKADNRHLRLPLLLTQLTAMKVDEKESLIT